MIKKALLISFVAASPAIADDAEIHRYADSEDVAMECALGFDQLRADVQDVERMELVSETDGEEAYMIQGVSFTLTKAGHDAHPMIVRREIIEDAGALDIKTSGCGFGDKEAFEKQLASYLELNQKFITKSKFRIDQ